MQWMHFRRLSFRRLLLLLAMMMKTCRETLLLKFWWHVNEESLKRFIRFFSLTLSFSFSLSLSLSLSHTHNTHAQRQTHTHTHSKTNTEKDTLIHIYTHLFSSPCLSHSLIHTQTQTLSPLLSPCSLAHKHTLSHPSFYSLCFSHPHTHTISFKERKLWIESSLQQLQLTWAWEGCNSFKTFHSNFF